MYCKGPNESQQPELKLKLPNFPVDKNVRIWPVLQYSIPDKFNRRTLSRSMVYRLLTLHERRSRLNYTYTVIVNNIC